jgi:hypothetical protein
MVISDENSANEGESLEVGEETLFGSTLQRIGEPKDSLMRFRDWLFLTVAKRVLMVCEVTGAWRQ